VHAEAAAWARDVGALAYTIGHDVVFGQGGGRELKLTTVNGSIHLGQRQI